MIKSRRILVETQEVKRSLGKPRLRWVDNNKMVLQEIGCGGIDCIELAEDKDQ
jgi:hypothetical protein